MLELVIKNGTIVESDRMYTADIGVKDGKIAVIGSIMETAEQICDAAGLYVFPGAVDAHMHIGEYQADFEDMRTSTKAALAGGVTTCIDMPLNLYSPSIFDAKRLNAKRELLEREAYTDFALWGGLVPESLNRLTEMYESGAAAFKCFMSGGGNDFAAPTIGQIRTALKTIAAFDGLAGFHCEDFSIIAAEKQYVSENQIDGRQAFLNSRPLSAELIAVRDIIELARETGARVHICHVSHPAVAAVIEQAQLAGVSITAETCAHYLTFSEEDYLEKGCLFGCAPPLRERTAREGLWEYLQKGVIGCVVSDHSPGMPENRSDAHQPTYQSGYGISGVQTMLQTVYDGAVNQRGLSPMLIARCFSEAPAKRWGLYGRKGAVKVGFDADLVLFDPNRQWTVDAQKLYYKQKITAFDGLSGMGMPIVTYLRGIKACEEGKILTQTGCGIFVRP